MKSKPKPKATCTMRPNSQNMFVYKLLTRYPNTPNEELVKAVRCTFTESGFTIKSARWHKSRMRTRPNDPNPFNQP